MVELEVWTETMWFLWIQNFQKKESFDSRISQKIAWSDPWKVKIAPQIAIRWSLIRTLRWGWWIDSRVLRWGQCIKNVFNLEGLGIEKKSWETKTLNGGNMSGKGTGAFKKEGCDPLTNYALFSTVSVFDFRQVNFLLGINKS